MAKEATKKPGRPPKAKGETLDDQIPASRCKAEERTRYEIAANAAGLSLTQWVRKTLNQAVEK